LRTGRDVDIRRQSKVVKRVAFWQSPKWPLLAKSQMAAPGTFLTSAQHLRGWDERRQAIAQATDKAGRTRDLLARDGIDCPTVTGAGTGTFEFETASGVYTELQCGSYIFKDADYGRNRDRDGAPIKSFEPSLFVWATVMSRPAEDRAIVDAGLKALAFDSGPPLVCDEPAATYERASDEHGRLAVAAATNRRARGDKIRLIPGHCDPTVNLYDLLVPAPDANQRGAMPAAAASKTHAPGASSRRPVSARSA
jgi:D-serine deaminase-like pyridoxal phosphate-dependent protein